MAYSAEWSQAHLLHKADMHQFVVCTMNGMGGLYSVVIYKLKYTCKVIRQYIASTTLAFQYYYVLWTILMQNLLNWADVITVVHDPTG